MEPPFPEVMEMSLASSAGGAKAGNDYCLHLLLVCLSRSIDWPLPQNAGPNGPSLIQPAGLLFSDIGSFIPICTLCSFLPFMFTTIVLSVGKLKF